MKILLISLIMFSFLASNLAYANLPGKYDVIIPNIPPTAKSLDKVHIDEVFSFTCPHCKDLNKQIPLIEKVFDGKVKISARPIGWVGQNPGRLFYIGMEKEKGQQVKDRIFSFVFDQNLGDQINEKTILKNVAILEGLSKDFDTMMEDPRIIKKMKDGMALADYAKIESTPTLIIEGVLTTSGDLKNLFEILNSLLKDPVDNPMQKYRKLGKKEKTIIDKERSTKQKKKGFFKSVIDFFSN